MRRWWEPSGHRTEFPKAHTDALRSDKRWFPYNKGGLFRKWYGNGEFVVNWENHGREIKGFADSSGKQLSRPQNTQFYFRESVSWSDVTADVNSFRWYPPGYIFDATGHSAFSDNVSVFQLLAMLNTKLMQNIAKILNPTMHFHVGYFRLLPAALLPESDVKVLVTEAISTSRQDWDNFETSWDFRDQPLLRPGLKGATLEASWRNWEAQSTAAIRRMQELETENNRLFIAAYGLDGELQPEVPPEQITLARAEARRDMAAFLSYAVGCMMGRYSPDYPGLVFANSGNEKFWDIYHEKHERDKDGNFSCNSCISWSTYPPDEDGILPVLDGEWFEDDIVARAKEFLRATFGDESLNTNIQFIEQSLGKELRKYFLTDFYKDHLQTYKKRPIYWLFSSGKQRAFQCLVYLHRYHEGTLARMRTEYAIPLQGRIASRIEQLDGDKLKATSTSHRNKLQKEQDDLKKKQAELLIFEQKLKHAADQKIALDLDDGVKVNYAKFGDLLAESKAICGTKEED